MRRLGRFPVRKEKTICSAEKTRGSRGKGRETIPQVCGNSGRVQGQYAGHHRSRAGPESGLLYGPTSATGEGNGAETTSGEDSQPNRI